MQFSLICSEFRNLDLIPKKYTCDGQNLSPPLSWNDPPEGTKAMVIIMDDPDAPMGVFTHWVLFNIPNDATELPEGYPNQPSFEDGSIQGINDFGKLGYGGPCPPPGLPHNYSFRLYAVDVKLSLKAGVSKIEVIDAIKGHIMSQAELIGRYGR